jgi:hypothetical protein
MITTFGNWATSAKLPTIDSSEMPKNVLEKLGQDTAITGLECHLFASAITPYLAVLTPLDVRWGLKCLLARLARVRKAVSFPEFLRIRHLACSLVLSSID